MFVFFIFDRNGIEIVVVYFRVGYMFKDYFIENVSLL